MSIIRKDSFFSICFLLISAATGMGVLTLPWAFRQTGLFLGIIVLLYWSILCSTTIYFLIMGGLHYKVSNITELMYYSILGEAKIENTPIEVELSSVGSKKRAKIASKVAALCDVLILFDCLFIIPCLLIFLSDFLIPINILVQQELPKLSVRYPGLEKSSLAKLFYNLFFSISLFFTERYRCIIFFCVIVFLLCIPNNFSAVKLVSVLSVFSSVSTAIIIIYFGLSSNQPPECQSGIMAPNTNFCRKGKIELFNYSSIREFWRITSVSNIILFSHFCHLILIPTTKNIHHMSTRKIKGIVLTFVSAIFIFNCSVGISGYSIFRLNTLPNIISNFAYNNPLVVLARVYLILSLTVTVCMEIIPLIDSFSSTIMFLFKSIGSLINKRKSEIEMTSSIKNSELNLTAKVDEETNSNQCTSTLASSVNLTPYFGINEQKEKSNEQIDLSGKKCPCNRSNFMFLSKDKLFKILNLIIVLTFSGIMAVEFSSVAKLIQVTGGTLDGIFVFIIPAWIYYSTYFKHHYKIFGITLLSLYLVNYVVASLSGIVGLFKVE
ncbi:Transmembrane amino acid transporter protein family protein [Cryptosporidium meleagridis]|uniref:Transmembrane amino acid transporter protein family protein n=1 Tax=Cryptosporidium meleagridis TaxID=93969 RepID=A0A2P4Z3S9_9CRYT|nr:Transmembrane amino acid transporter protein family protein [Cryptosporidium meleagridis]